MKLAFDQIKKITLGAVRIEQHSEGIHFYRFTKEQEEYYAATEYATPPKHLATAGIRLLFRTDSRSLKLKVEVIAASSRKFFAFDVYVNGHLLGYLGNYSEEEKHVNYYDYKGELGEFTGEFTLPEGEKEVCIHFPYTMSGILQELSLDNGAEVVPVKREKRMITYGDSITHGYDALHPSKRYTAQLADALGAEEICKGIGGECFRPELALLKDDFTPDYITVAYGTNDWSHCTKEQFLKNCEGFFTNLTDRYPKVPIAALTPIWRKDHVEGRPDGCGDFAAIEEMIVEITAKYPQITCISARQAVPEDIYLFGDLRLHPTDEGFCYYYEGIVEQVREAFQ